MDKSTKRMLKELTKYEHRIPRRLWLNVLWLQENESFGIERYGRIHFKDEKGKNHIRSWKGFFAGKSIPLDEKRIKEICRNYLLIVHQDRIKARDIVKCQNVEIRRHLLKEYGYQRFLQELSGEVINREGDSELVKLQVRKDEEPLTVVKVRDSTSGELYILRVPPTVRTCREAIAWTFGLEPDEYDPIVET